MGAAGFVTLAGHFTDRTVVTYDPRGAERSKRTDNADQTTPDEHADDGENTMAAAAGIRETYQRDGFGPAMAKFIALVSHEVPLPDGYADQPGPDPAMFGLPAEDDGSRDDPLVGQNIVTCIGYQHDFDALRAAPTRVVIGGGEKSGTIFPGRAAVAVAERLGSTPVTFPGGHDGFLGGEYGGMGEPDAFAATLREVLAGWGKAEGFDRWHAAPATTPPDPRDLPNGRGCLPQATRLPRMADAELIVRTLWVWW
jgi:hypothetical protein